MTTPKEVGKIFEEARKKRNLTLEDAANQSHIHVKVLGDIEGGVFDRLGKIYIKSFMKKYCEFLCIETEAVIKEYESASQKVPTKEFTLLTEKRNIVRDRKAVVPEAKKEEPVKKAQPVVKKFVPVEKKPAEKKNVAVKPRKSISLDDVNDTLAERKKKTMIIAACSLIVAAGIFFTIGSIRAKMQSGFSEARYEKVTAEVTEPSVAPVEKETPAKVASEPNLAAPVVMVIKANDEVWLQVSEGKKVIYDGVMKTGDSKSWKSNGKLTVWTGKADKLDFTVNHQKLGKVASGVVKNIKVSAEGVRVGDTWVSRFD